MWGNQEEAFEIISDIGKSVTLELPTGSGKTAIGYTFLKTLEKQGEGPLFYIVPNKTLVEQVKHLHPDVVTVYGRNEYPCFYYERELVTAEESPCSMLDCPHRVDQETGETEGKKVNPCPYLYDKYKAKQGGIIVCTMSFYLFAQLFTEEWPKPAGLVIDEAHQFPKVVRNALKYEITDYHLRRGINLLSEINPEASKALGEFLQKMVKVIRRRPANGKSLLEDHDVKELIERLLKIKTGSLQREVKSAVGKGKISPEDQRDVLKRLETITRNLSRYLRSLEYSLPGKSRGPLNYTYASYKYNKMMSPEDNIQYRLFINCYYVAPLIARILSPFTVAYSATIGDPDIFGFETGIKSPCYTFPSEFLAEKAGVFLPKDTPNLAMKARSRQDLTRTLRKVAKACRRFADSGTRSLVVVISNAERDKFLMLCEEENVSAVSYGNGIKPREAIARFKEGEGDVLVGTVSNYGEGVDLPGSIAPVIFFLRPGFPRPNDPATLFEERRFGSMRWRLWNWRVMIEALQVRGRNIRSTEDLGVTFFISQQFRRFIPAVLPDWLRDSYEGGISFEQGIEETEKLLFDEKAVI